MSATSAARAYTCFTVGDVHMVQVNESAMRSGVREYSPSSLRPTIYRPSGPAATHASGNVEGVISVSGEEGVSGEEPVSGRTGDGLRSDSASGTAHARC